MHLIMQMPKYINIIVERADFSLIMLRFSNTGTMFFCFVLFFYYCFISIIIYLFVRRIFILFNSTFIATFYYLTFILT